ncbi:M20/M25/M40 family metallo-hydrolase [Aneurinibacillus sp. Ricciae_BoGa-3]|uniref:M20/M25/M40 family metallo-hydrolase n=1 Tax=Aneurinibacillus sp. Ricciae_BoGa-3 TaxID=3022697 RepID=UPI002341E333|nr:M20/M25/M40 family metallo-hydrolase [Aneurinibacillus sp. Ricciae_BoGa-3]WCK54436.1 M20/M25/M40 family metallo-hydrolase [Aneurinibacillus sp. Ricciae_BoGa-3]
MDAQAKQFLTDLLATPSPSGMEVEIQKKWMNYVKQFADKMETDTAGNVIGILNPDADFKVLIAGHCDEIGFIVNRIDEQGFVYVDKVGGISHKPAIGMKVEILGEKQRITGVIGANAEHHGGVKDDFEFSDLYIDCGAKSKEEIARYVQIGDMAVYKRQLEFLLNGRISGRGLDNRTGAFIAAEVLRSLAQKQPSVGVYAVSTVNEETNMGGAYFAGSAVMPTMAIAVDVTFATDYPGVNTNKYGLVNLEEGPVLAKGAPVNRKINKLLEESARRLGIPLQYELTPRSTGTDADKLRLTGKGVPVALVSLPLRYMHSPVETASLHDMEQEIALLIDMILNLTGKEGLKPLED